MQEKLEKWKLLGIQTWTLIGIGIIVVAALNICGIIDPTVAILITTGCIVFMLHGVVNRLERIGINRVIGSALSIILVILVIVLFFVMLVPALVDQITTLINNIPTYATMLRDFAYDIADDERIPISASQLSEMISTAQTKIMDSAGTIATNLASGAMGIGKSIGVTFLVAFISLLAALWLLIDLPKISREFRNLFNEKQQQTLDLVTDSFGSAIYGWAKATFVCAALDGVLIGVIFMIVGVPYPAVLGLACGMLYIIPYIGPAIGYVVCAIIGLTVSLPMCIATIVINLVVRTVIVNVLSPSLMASTVSVHPAITLIVIIMGEALGGIFGMLAAVPIAAAVQTIFVTIYEGRTGKSLYSEDGALFQKKKESHVTGAVQRAGDTLTNLHLPKDGKH